MVFSEKLPDSRRSQGVAVFILVKPDNRIQKYFHIFSPVEIFPFKGKEADMKTIFRLLSGLLPAILLAGCGANMEMIRSKSQSQASHIFQEVKGTSQPPAGYADLVVKSSLKTHLPGYYLVEAKSSPHGQPTYTFVVNIDGQATTYEVQGRREDGPAVYDQGRTSSEKGVGMQYVLDRNFRLKAGRHKIFLGLPGDQYFKEVDVTLQEGESYELDFQPHYRRYKWGREAFENGLCGYAASLKKI